MSERWVTSVVIMALQIWWLHWLFGDGSARRHAYSDQGMLRVTIPPCPAKERPLRRNSDLENCLVHL
jgi:hypothetical protein